ncbi:MAG: histidine kinase [Flavobacteriales bacterium]|nr:MAG: histidine kinase [Flavobacteriales bacterium]
MRRLRSPLVFCIIFFSVVVVSAQEAPDTAVSNARARASHAASAERSAAFSALSMACIKAGRSTEAWAAADTAVSFAQGDSAKAECLLQRALAADYDGRTGPGLADAQQAIDIAHRIPSLRLELAGLFRCQSLHLNVRNFERSRDYGMRWLNTAGAAPDINVLKKVLNNLGSAFYQEARPDSAEAYYQRILEVIAPDDAVFRNMALANLANVYTERGEYDRALAMMDSTSTTLAGSSPNTTFGVLTTRGYILHSAKRYAESNLYFDSALALNRAELKDIAKTVECLGFLADNHAALSDYEQGFNYLRQLEFAQDSLNQQNANDKILALEEGFQADLRKRDIELLTASNAEKAERIKRKDQLLYASIIGVALALIASALFYRNYRQKRKHADLLAGLNRTLEGQKNEIEEINRLLQLKVLRTQMNPHFIYNSLSAIAALTQKGEQAQALAYLQGFARLLRQVLDHSVADRVPLSEEIDFLRQYLKLESLRFEGGINYTVDADTALLDDDADVPALLVQPFVENAVWHGLAYREGEKRLSVRFVQSNGSIRCTVEDNGMGRAFNPGPKPGGHKSVGVQLTNERLQLLSFRLGQEGRAEYEDLVGPDERPGGTRVVLHLH